MGVGGVGAKLPRSVQIGKTAPTLVGMPQRAAIYCRLSYAPDGSVEKVDRQEGDCRQLADRLGDWRITDKQLQPDAPPGVFRDNSRSAWKRDRNRPGWDLFLDAIRDREIDGVLIYHGDRLIRQPYDLELLLQLTDQYALPLASPSGVRDLSSADDRFILRVEAAQACRESDNISRRVTRGWNARAQKGLASGGGYRPFGFSDGSTVDPDEAEIVADAAARLLAGQSLSGVVRWLNQVSTTSTGGEWTIKGIKQVLRAPRVAGLIYNQGITYEAAWEPIISVADWEEVKALLDESAKTNPYAGRARRHLLTGIAECSACGGTMTTKPSGGRNRKSSRIYHCKQCRKMGRNTAHLDEYIIGRVLRRVNEPEFLADLFNESTGNGVGAEIAALERRRDQAKQQLTELAEHPDLSPALIAKSLESFESKIADLRDQQAVDTRQRVLARAAGLDRPAWDELPIDVRAGIVRALFRITVLPATWHGPGFDPDSVRVERVEG